MVLYYKGHRYLCFRFLTKLNISMPRLPDNYIPVVPAINLPTYEAPPPTRGMPPLEGIDPPDETGAPGYQFPRVDLPIIYPSEPVIDAGNTKENEKEEEEEEEDSREMKDDEIPMRPFDAATRITIPYVGEIPVPKPEVVITAGTTAAVATVAATGTAVFAKPMFDQVMKVMKPLVKKIIAKILKKKKVDYSKVRSQPVELPALHHFYTNHQVQEQLRPDTTQHKEKTDEETPQP